MKFSKEEPVETEQIEPWKILLEPFASLHHDMEKMIYGMPDDALATLADACKQASTTNCWSSTFYAANWIKPQIDRQQRVRARNKRSENNGSEQ